MFCAKARLKRFNEAEVARLVHILKNLEQLLFQCQMFSVISDSDLPFDTALLLRFFFFFFLIFCEVECRGLCQDRKRRQRPKRSAGLREARLTFPTISLPRRSCLYNFSCQCHYNAIQSFLLKPNCALEIRLSHM